MNMLRLRDFGPAPDGDGRLVTFEPYAEPNPIPGRGPHDHFDRLAKIAVASWHLRHVGDDEAYGLYRQRPERGIHPRVTYDPARDAAAARVPNDGNKLGVAGQLYLKHPVLDATNCTSIVFQAQYMLSDSLRRANTYTGVSNKNGKRVRVESWKFDRHDPSDWDRTGIETQWRWVDLLEHDFAVIPTLRSYRGAGNSTSTDPRDPISGPVKDPIPRVTNYDRHPGPDSSWCYKGGPTTHPDRFALYAGRWITQTKEITWSAIGEVKVRIWFEDEETSPRLVIADYDDPTQGFNINGPGMKFGGWRFPEMDTSKGAKYDPPHEPWTVWVRNALVLKDVRGEDVLGGRPIGVPAT